jgi:nucleosome binding factor SPN SPT16 subunit
VKKLSKYAVLVADMVCITTDTADVLTKMGKNLTDVAYNINEEESDEGGDGDDDEDESVDAPDAPEGDEEMARKLSRDRGGTRTSSRLAKDASALTDVQEGVAERERRQIELMNRRNDERLRELARSSRVKGGESEKDQAEELQTYKRTRDYPDNTQPNQVKVDMANQCIILPICGNPVPFHISTIKNIVMPDDDSATLLRLNFYTAGMAVGKDAPANMAKLVAKYAPYASFIREMTFRSLDGHNLTLVRCKDIFVSCFSSRLHINLSSPFLYVSSIQRLSDKYQNSESVRERVNCTNRRNQLSWNKKSL